MTRIRDAVSGIRTHNGQPLSPKNLRWAATHEALCRSYIFDVLMGLADAIEREESDDPNCLSCHDGRGLAPGWECSGCGRVGVRNG